MRFDADRPGRLTLRAGGGGGGDADDGDAVAEYVYAPDTAPVESPRPFLRMRSRSGVEVTGHRPADHVWHTGLSLALPVVGPHSFWGGPTYVRGEGYLPLPTNGAQEHRSFALLTGGDDGQLARLTELLDWTSAEGGPVLTERRTLTARLVDDRTWAMTWHSTLRNASGAELVFGSPATNGREGAGYGGVFWRGPTAFSGGEIVGTDGRVGDPACGARAPWLAFVAPDRSVGVLMLGVSDGSSTEDDPWFARSAEYAGLGPAPFFTTERTLEPDGRLVLRAAVVVGAADVAALAPTVGAVLVSELRSHIDPSEDAA